MKKIAMLILGLLVVSLLSGCSELVERTHINDYVTITDADYSPGYSSIYLIGGTIYDDTVDPDYIIEYEYNGTEDCVDDEDIYNKYRDKIGEKVPAVIRVDTYDDGTIKYIVESVDWDIDEDKD